MTSGGARSRVPALAQYVWDADADGLFDALEDIPDAERDALWVECDRAFAKALHDLLGQESSIDRMVFTARHLEKGALRVITPIPYLFEGLIRRQYGEPEIVAGVVREEIIIHSLVGAALLRPNDAEQLANDAESGTAGE